MKVWMILLILLVALVGCQEQQKVEGELPAEWQELFGDGLMARLNYVQTQTINQHKQVIDELAKRVRSLEEENVTELAERVRKLEEND